MTAQAKHHWTAVAAPAPRLTKNQWYFSSLAGAIFIVAALLQIISFQDFSDNLNAMGLAHARWWGGVIIYAELWAAAGFFKIRLSWLFRKFSNVLAQLVAGFWFYETIRAVANGSGASFTANGHPTSINANFFGRFLSQSPGWWTVAEATAFIFLVLYTLDWSRQGSAQRAQVVTKVTHRHGK